MRRQARPWRLRLSLSTLRVEQRSRPAAASHPKRGAAPFQGWGHPPGAPSSRALPGEGGGGRASTVPGRVLVLGRPLTCCTWGVCARVRVCACVRARARVCACQTESLDAATRRGRAWTGSGRGPCARDPRPAGACAAPTTASVSAASGTPAWSRGHTYSKRTCR